MPDAPTCFCGRVTSGHCDNCGDTLPAIEVVQRVGEDAEQDPLLGEVIEGLKSGEFLREAAAGEWQPSVSRVQRRFRIGYMRAARLIEKAKARMR